MTDSALHDYIERAGAGAVLMVSPEARRDIRHNSSVHDWCFVGNMEHYRGARIELHDEWSWGWMVRKADGTYVERAASADTRPKGQDAQQGLAGTASGAVGEAETPKGASHDHP